MRYRAISIGSIALLQTIINPIFKSQRPLKLHLNFNNTLPSFLYPFLPVQTPRSVLWVTVLTFDVNFALTNQRLVRGGLLSILIKDSPQKRQTCR